MRVRAAVHAVVQHRLQQRCLGVRLRAQPLPGAGGGRAGHGHHHTGQCLAHQAELAAVVQPQSVGFLAAGQHILHVQHAAGHLQPGQARTGVLADFIHSCAKFRPLGRRAGQRLQAVQQGVQTVQPQRRAEEHREHLPPGNRGHHGFGGCRAGLEHLIHQRLTAQGQRLGVGRGGEIHTAVPEPPAQLPQTHGGIRAG